MAHMTRTAADLCEFKTLVDGQEPIYSEPDDGYLVWKPYGWEYVPGPSEIRRRQQEALLEWHENKIRAMKRRREQFPTLPGFPSDK